MKRNKLTTAFYFILSSIITWMFIENSNQYADETKKILSAAIAGGKWSIQTIATFFLLKAQRWLFLKNIGLPVLSVL